MVSRSTWLGLFSALLFVVTQTLWFAHGIESVFHHDASDEISCSICIAPHGTGGIISEPSSTAQNFRIAAHAYRPAYASIVYIDAEAVQPRQHGPPFVF